MKMGELRIISGMGGSFGFVLATPAGPRDVTLRVDTEGHVMVEEIAGGGISLEPLRITQVDQQAQQHQTGQADPGLTEHLKGLNLNQMEMDMSGPVQTLGPPAIIQPRHRA